MLNKIVEIELEYSDLKEVPKKLSGLIEVLKRAEENIERILNKEISGAIFFDDELDVTFTVEEVKDEKQLNRQPTGNDQRVACGLEPIPEGNCRVPRKDWRSVVSLYQNTTKK